MKSTFDLLCGSPFFQRFDPADLRYLAKNTRIQAFTEGQPIIRQDAPATVCYMLVVGTIRLSFEDGENGGEASPGGAEKGAGFPIRTFSDPGRFVGWSAMIEPYLYHGTITALEPTQMLVFDKEMLDRYIAENKPFGVIFMHRVIWAMERRLRETRVRLVARRYEKETFAVRALLEQSADVLSVDSPMHRIPFYLENRLTLVDAFEALDYLKLHGDRNEQGIALVATEILGRVRKELQLYQDLQSVYEAVARAPEDMASDDVRRRCCEEFTTLFSRTDCVIKGKENLPDEPGHIVVMNHLFNHPENTLPNDFQLTMDSHFVSSMILFAKYGDAPIRIVRKSSRAEFGHQKYYDRLGYIYVYTGEEDEPGEDPRAKRSERRQAFLDEARDFLLSGKNIVICPEGTSVSTERSPMPFKAGAFLLAAHVRPEPLIIPIAIANFDKKITHVKLSAVIYQPIRMSEFVPEPEDKQALFDFVNSLHGDFKGYVKEAVELSA